MNVAQIDPPTRRQISAALQRGGAVLAYADKLGKPVVSPFPVRERLYRLGRHPLCELTLDDPYVSSKHALLDVFAWSDVYVENLSSNGTLLNGRPVVGRQRLLDGAVLRLGETSLLVRVAGEAIPTSPTSGAAGRTGALSDLSSRQFAAVWWLASPLRDLGSAEPMNQSDLCERLGIAASALGELLGRAADVLGVRRGHGLSARLAKAAIDQGIHQLPAPDLTGPTR